MYRRILLPTNGSELCVSAVKRGIEFAKEIGASVVGFHAIPATSYLIYTEAGPSDVLAEQFEKDAMARGQKLVDEVCDAATAAGVANESLLLTNDHPWEAIIEAAATKGCDLIFMASHGRRGLSALLLGSETARVLTHTTIPVLVYR
ncbi:MAG TPA: universal stress protein [Burkholderiales bacterium]|jgi:nucleotide-binding universal stress UspA family protein|nr:universal stress protein [Burkholderiales bacterium]